MKKICSVCKIEKDICEYFKRGRRKSYETYCRECKHIKKYPNYIKPKVYDLDGEIWRDVVGWVGFYMVSNIGRIKSNGRIFVKKNNSIVTLKERIYTPFKLPNGYLQIHLKNGIISKSFNLHRLIALAFIPNYENKPCINHINGIKTDNRIENLEWCSYSENNAHAYRIGLRKVNWYIKQKADESKRNI